MKAIIKTLPIFSNRKTIVVYFLLLPVINMIFLASITYQYNSEITFKVALSAVLVSGSLEALSTINSSFTIDRNLGIDREMLSNNHFSLYYWICKIIPAFLIALAIIVVNLFIVYAISLGKANITDALLISPLIIFSGIVLGILSSVLSWNLKNPYFFSNIFSTFGNILAGVVISYQFYPPVLRYFTYLVPYAHTISYLYGNKSGIIYDLFLNIIFICAIIIIYKRQVRIVTSKSKFSTL